MAYFLPQEGGEELHGPQRKVVQKTLPPPEHTHTHTHHLDHTPQHEFLMCIPGGPKPHGGARNPLPHLHNISEFVAQFSNASKSFDFCWNKKKPPFYECPMTSIESIIQFRSFQMMS